MAKEPINLKDQAQELLEMAIQTGVDQSFLFITTFDRYQTQVKIAADLKKVVNEQSALVTKEYVKGRGNIYVHPAITEYNKTAQAANHTAQTLLKIITTLGEHSIADNIESEDDEL